MVQTSYKVALLLVSLLCVPSCKKPGCQNDRDCKGDRICQEGKCVDPTGTPATSPPPPKATPPEPSKCPAYAHQGKDYCTVDYTSLRDAVVDGEDAIGKRLRVRCRYMGPGVRGLRCDGEGTDLLDGRYPKKLRPVVKKLRMGMRIVVDMAITEKGVLGPRGYLFSIEPGNAPLKVIRAGAEEGSRPLPYGLKAPPAEAESPETPASASGRLGPAPRVVAGRAEVRGSLDREIIRRIIRRHINQVQYCYQQGLESNPDLGGRVVVQFTIAADGSVVMAKVQSSTLKNKDVEGCLTRAVRRWLFPKPKGGGIVIVSYPFVLRPAR